MTMLRHTAQKPLHHSGLRAPVHAVSANQHVSQQGRNISVEQVWQLVFEPPVVIFEILILCTILSSRTMCGYSHQTTSSHIEKLTKDSPCIVT